MVILTAQQKEIICRLAMPNKQIGKELGIVTGTVKNRLSCIYKCFLGENSERTSGHSSRIKLLLILLRLGLIQLDELHLGRLRQGEENVWCW